MHTRKRVSTVSERSREDEPKRWASPRKKQRTDYVSTEGSEDSGSSLDILEEDEEKSEEMLHRWPHWDVSCGTKKGILHVENLEKGQENCIESEGCWFSPSGFEEFGGKGKHKKWKKSIIYKNQPLNFWIDCHYLKSPPHKRYTFTASEPSEHKKSHPEESEDINNYKEEVGPDEEPAETSEDQTESQNGEQKNDVTICIAGTVSQRKPLLILHRLEPLQGDFHLLLNDVLLQNGSRSMSTEMQSKEEVDTYEDETPEPFETSELQEETSLYCSDTENEQKDEVEILPIEDTEDTVIIQDQGVDTVSVQEVIIEDVKNQVEIVAPISQMDLEAVGAAPPNVIIEDSAQLIERPTREENPSAVVDDPPATAQGSSEVDAMDLEQLKMEKIKWQIKVLKLQEEYYSLQIQKLKK